MENFSYCDDRGNTTTIRMKGQLHIISDWHLNHGQKSPDEKPRGIIKHCKRPFSCTREMDKTIIDNTNDIVTEDDWLINAGDLLFLDRKSPLRDYEFALDEYFKRIRCKNILLIWGNHDKALRHSHSLRTWFKGWNNRIELSYRGRDYVVDHYPLSEWDGAFHGVRHLYAHCHGSLENPKNPHHNPNLVRIDVCVDLHGFKPLNFNQVEALLEPKERRHEELKARLYGDEK